MKRKQRYIKSFCWCATSIETGVLDWDCCPRRDFRSGRVGDGMASAACSVGMYGSMQEMIQNPRAWRKDAGPVIVKHRPKKSKEEILGGLSFKVS
jgi:hypothetical protein